MCCRRFDTWGPSHDRPQRAMMLATRSPPEPSVPTSAKPSLWSHLHGAMHRPSHPAWRWVEGMVWTTIVVSVAIVGLELALESLPPALAVVDQFLLVFFGLEVVMRILTFRPPELDLLKMTASQRLWAHFVGRLRYCLQPLVLFDIIAVMAVVPALRGLRAMRMLRLARSFRSFPLASPLRGLAQAVREHGLLYGVAFSVLGGSTIIGGSSLYLAEHGTNPDLTTLADAIWWALVTLTTVGYGDISPMTPIGRVVGGAMMVVGMITLALFAGIVGNTMLSSVMRVREEQFRMSSSMNHVVVCGWEPGARMLLDAILAEIDTQTTELVIFAPNERPANVPPEFRWVSGDATKESELGKARMESADAALIVGSRALSPQDADARTLLTAFTIRSYMDSQPTTARRLRALYLVTEILDAENVRHARTAGADEVIETTRIGFSLLSHAIVQRGTAELLGRITAAGAHSLYVGNVPDDIELPAPFSVVSTELQARHRLMVIGLTDTEGRAQRLNPRPDAIIRVTDRIIYLAESALLPVKDQWNPE